MLSEVDMQFDSASQALAYMDQLLPERAADHFAALSYLFAKTSDGNINDDEYYRVGVGLRDAGFSDHALKGFRIVSQLRPSDRIYLEILIILTQFRFDESLIIHVLNEVHDDWLSNSAVALLVAYASYRIGNLRLASQTFAQVERNDIYQNLFFLKLYNETHSHLIISAGHLTKTLGSEYISEALSRAVMREHVVSQLQNLSILEFEDALRRMVFGGGAERLNSDIVSEALVLIMDRVEYEKLPVAFRMLVALHKFSEAKNYMRFIEATPVRQNPDYIKTLVRLGELSDDALIMGVANDLALEATSSAYRVEDQDAMTQIRLAEVRARAAVLSELRALGQDISDQAKVPDKHFFIGFFGQLRYPKQNFQSLLSYIAEHIAPLQQEGWTVSYGISTWRETGRRPLALDNPIGFLLEILPVELHALVKSTGASSISAFRSLFPQTTEFLMRQSMDTQEVDKAFVESLSGMPIYSVIGDEDLYMQQLGVNIHHAFNGDDHYLNQGKMWSRLSGLAEVVSQAEVGTGRKISHAMLVRPDLIFPNNGLHKYFENLIYSKIQNIVYTDEDVHATFIEGLGDRYMLCDRAGLDCILGGYDKMADILTNPEKDEYNYRFRLKAHQFLESLLFQSAVQNVRVSSHSLPISLYRGRRGLEELIPYLKLDAQSTTGPIAELVTEVLARFG